MGEAILQTKFHAPGPRPETVARPRLEERLSLGARSRLTLVSAPPGFGKSTVVGEWISAHPGFAAGWVSLDPNDNEPVTFWTYVVTAVRTAAPAVGAEALSMLSSPQPRTEAGLRSLLNDLATHPDDVVLVLDDFHVIDRPEVLDGVGFLLDRAPPTVHIVIVSRADPPLPLSRLRARGELLEIRAADLRFTPDEAAEYLNGAMGLELAGRDLAALEARTEGWIAALQLAALSMQGRDDVPSFIRSFAGDDRFVVDYLVDEVLARQTADVRAFLMFQRALLGPTRVSGAGKRSSRSSSGRSFLAVHAGSGPLRRRSVCKFAECLYNRPTPPRGTEACSPSTNSGRSPP